jgi:hypothetical protein
MALKSKIMFIENKGDGEITGESWIGRVTFSKTGKTIYYREKTFQSLKGQGFKSNYYDINTKEEYWISECKKNGNDRLYPGKTRIDEDVREEYWCEIRNLPDKKDNGEVYGSKY